MRRPARWIGTVCCLSGIVVVSAGLGCAEERVSKPATPPKSVSSDEFKVEEPNWMQAIPVPADVELERQIKEVQEALGAIYKEMVRRKEALKKEQDPAAKATLFDEFERLRKEREDLEKLLHDLVDEAKLSEQTEIDAALARARWLERQQEYQQQKEEIIRDRQP